MSDKFVPTVTISLEEYKQLKFNETFYKNLPRIKESLQDIVRFHWGYCSRQEFDDILLRISRLLNENSIWKNNNTTGE